MWFLECDGSVLNHKRIWLRPGKRYLFGRTSTAGNDESNQHNYVISDKSVSRKHLIISVAEVPAGNATLVYEKSKCTIQDDSKIGTYLDGQKVVKDSRLLTKKAHKIQLGSFNEVFRISWRPTVFTFSLTSKQQERMGSTDMFAPYRTTLEPLDIKLTNDYLVNETTHVICAKRNHPKGLLALLNATYLVVEQFMDAVAKVADLQARNGNNSPVSQCPLEIDFDTNWPNALDFVPPAGKEPNPRPAEIFAPNPARVRVFEGLTFVFADESQYINLQTVGNNGGAKCHQFPLKRNETTVGEMIEYVESLAGKKDKSNSSDRDDMAGVVFVRFPIKDQSDTWAIDFIRGIDRALGRRSIEQNEFLGAILENDTSSLLRPLEEEESLEDDVPFTSASTRIVLPPSTNIEPSQSVNNRTAGSQTPPHRPRARRILAKNRFKGWDELDSQPLELERDSRQIPEAENEQSVSQNASSQGLFVSDSQQPEVGATETTSRKRAHPLSDDEDEQVDHQEQMMDALLPAAATMKRRRLENHRLDVPTDPKRSKSRSTSADLDKNTLSSKGAKAKAPTKEIDVRATTRSHATELDKRRGRRNRSASQDPVKGVAEEDADINYDDVDPNISYNLAAIAEMEITPRNGAQATSDQRSDVRQQERWNDSWNGRKNFKGFRRKGQQNGADGVNVRGHRRVIVALEPAKKKDYGIGEHYWVTNGNGDSEDGDSSGDEDPVRSQSRGRGQPQSQRQGQSQRAAASRNATSVAVDDDQDDPDPQNNVSKQATTTAASHSRAGTSKRPASIQPGSKPPPVKRQRQTKFMQRNEDDDGDEEEDELKFRSRRRR